MNTIKKIIGISVLAVILSSCDSFLKDYSQDLVKVNGWEDLEEVLLGNGYIMSCMPYEERGALRCERDLEFDMLYLMSDELTPNDPYHQNDDESGMFTNFAFATWQQDTGVDSRMNYVGGDEKYWDECYTRINVCNMVIGVIDDQPEHKPEDRINKERVKGEAYFLRSLYYFMLANLYCEPYSPATAETMPGVPLKLTEYVEDVEYSRGSIKDTYRQILSDLEMAAGCLKGKERKNLYRADYNSARLLAARTSLYMQDWEMAIEYASEVMDNVSDLKNYNSAGEGQNVINASSPEVIFSNGDHCAAFTFQDDMKSDRRGYTTFMSVAPEYEALYSDDDSRKRVFFGPTENYGVRTLLKFNCQPSTYGSYHSVGNTILFRTPEVYLILAEANAYLGNDSEARAVLNKFLRNRYPDLTVNLAGNNLIDFIRDERAREFVMEGGHRWFDLRRYCVNTVYPWSKTIEHRYPYYDSGSVDYYDWYELEKNDAAYTLPIPRAVRQFQSSIGNNTRPVRNYVRREQL